MSNEWKVALRAELGLSLTAYTEGGNESAVSLGPDFKEGIVVLEWEDDTGMIWLLTIPNATLQALAGAMKKP